MDRGGGWAGVGAALGMWAASRVVVVVGIVWAAYTRGIDRAGLSENPVGWLVDRFAHWDSNIYGALATRGYPPAGTPASYDAFFPGFPLLLRYLSPPGVNVRVTGLVIVTLSGAAGAVLLWRLARQMLESSQAALWSVTAYAVSPLSVFFTVIYTEALFLALALAAWLMGRAGRWGWAGLLAGLACTLRVTGLFVVAGLVVMYVFTERSRPWWRPRREILALGTGPAVVAAWMTWLHGHTGRWDAWTIAQREGFGRAATWPSAGLQDSLNKISEAGSWHLEVVRIGDVVAVVLACVFAALLLRRRWWPEAAYGCLCAIPMLFSTIFDSAPRYLLAVFPAYVLLGAAASHRPRIAGAAAALSATVMLGYAYGWGARWWIG